MSADVALQDISLGSDPLDRVVGIPLRRSLEVECSLTCFMSNP
jgi:hypothetical protein